MRLSQEQFEKTYESNLKDNLTAGGKKYLFRKINQVESDNSFETIKLEHSQGLVNGPTILNKINNYKPAKLKFGEVIVFNPFILHGNVDFMSNVARIACSVRFQSRNKPIMQKNTDFFKLYDLN